MRHELALILALTACGTNEDVRAVVRDPSQVAVVRESARGARSRWLDAGERERGAAWRDEHGHPHVELHADYAWEGDALVTHEEPIVEGTVIRFRARVRERGWCWRPVHRCWLDRGWIDLVTARSNVELGAQ